MALRMKGPNKPLRDVVEGLSRPTIDIVAFPGDQKLDPPSSLPPRDDLLDVVALWQQRPFSAPPGPAAVLVGFREISIFLSLNNWRSACHEGAEGWGGGGMRHINREVPSCAPQRPIAPDGGAAHRTHSCEAEPAGRVEPSGRGGGGPGKPRAAVRGDMWRGHGGGDGAVLGARSAHCSAEKGVMSGVFGPSSSRTVAREVDERRSGPHQRERERERATYGELGSVTQTAGNIDNTSRD